MVDVGAGAGHPAVVKDNGIGTALQQEVGQLLLGRSPSRPSGLVRGRPLEAEQQSADSRMALKGPSLPSCKPAAVLRPAADSGCSHIEAVVHLPQIGNWRHTLEPALTQALAGDTVTVGIEPMRIPARPAVLLIEILGSPPSGKVGAVLVASGRGPSDHAKRKHCGGGSTNHFRLHRHSS